VFFALDQFACRWQQREDVARLIQPVLSYEDIREMLMSGIYPVIEFGLIMLRLVVSNGVAKAPRPFLKCVFLEMFPVASPLFRLDIAKIFLTITLNRGASMYRSWVPMTIAGDLRDLIEGNLTNFEKEYYPNSIRILENLLRRKCPRDQAGEPSEDEISD
jgi:hypothetical protein